jgi:hypothetical protein
MHDQLLIESDAQNELERPAKRSRLMTDFLNKACRNNATAASSTSTLTSTSSTSHAPPSAAPLLQSSSFNSNQVAVFTPSNSFSVAAAAQVAEVCLYWIAAKHWLVGWLVSWLVGLILIVHIVLYDQNERLKAWEEKLKTREKALQKRDEEYAQLQQTLVVRHTHTLSLSLSLSGRWC